MDPLVSQDWLAARLEEPRLRVVDCRFTLGDPLAGRAAYEAGHIPGAVFLDLDHDLSDPPAAPGARGPVGGRHPLPALDRFAAAVRHAGIGTGTTVVAYDDAMSGGAARLWWLLRHCGFADVAVLDGGLAAWEGPLRAGGEPPPAAGDFTPAAARRRPRHRRRARRRPQQAAARAPLPGPRRRARRSASAARSSRSTPRPATSPAPATCRWRRLPAAARPHERRQDARRLLRLRA